MLIFLLNTLNGYFLQTKIISNVALQGVNVGDWFPTMQSQNQLFLTECHCITRFEKPKKKLKLIMSSNKFILPRKKPTKNNDELL
jgi:hypothetical protein